MRIVLGVDDKDRAKEVTSLLQALRFPETKIDIVRVIESLGDATPPPVKGWRGDAIVQYRKMLTDEGEELLKTVSADIKQRDFAQAETHLVWGLINKKLIEHAEKTNADLTAVASSGKGSVEGVLIGSTARKLVIASKRSVLVAKNYASSSRPLKVVLATDHSAYANKCVDEFLRWAPRGIGQLTVVTVFPEQLVQAITSVVEHFKADVTNWVRKELEQSNQSVISRLKNSGIECKSRVESGFVTETLERVMKEEAADLLIMGAQGHGFVDRLTLGSVSLDQVVKKPYSVLVVRV
jgi:nucleotide-binding universal stress UspA family protein